MKRPLAVIFGVLAAVFFIGGALTALYIVGIASVFEEKSGAVDLTAAFERAVIRNDLGHAWSMLAPEVQVKLNRADFMQAQGDFGLIAQEFRDAEIALGAGKHSGPNFRMVGTLVQNIHGQPGSLEYVVMTDGDYLTIGNIWAKPGP